MREELRGVLQAYYIGIGGSVAWGNIVDNIENQLDLMAQFNARVPVSRTISINGQTYDLSENRSWTVNTNNYSDADFTIYDDADNTKVLNFSVGGVSTGTTRTLTVPDASGTIALTSDLSAYLTTAAAASTYATIASLSSYLTTATAASTYVPYTGATGAVNLGANNLTVDTSVFFVDATNNWVRIGTTGNRQNDLLEISRNSNSVTGFSVSNTTSDTSARARFSVESNANRGVFFNVFSDGWTANPSYTAGSAALECDMLNGFQLRVLSSASLSFWTNNLRRGSFTSAGLFAIGDTVTSTSPALKRSSTELQVRLADDSAFAPLQAAATTINGNLTVDTNTFFVDAANDFVGFGTTSQTVNERVNVRRDFNGVNRLVIQNSTDGTTSSNSLRLISPTKIGLLNLYAAGYTTSGMFQADTMLMYTNATNGINIGSDSALPIKFWVNNTQVGAWTTDGLFAVGSVVTSAGVALKRSSTELQVRLADDSAFAPFQAAATIFESGIIGGTSLNASALFQIDSTTKGFAPPRMTGTQVEAIGTPLEGLVAYATSAGGGSVTSKGYWHYNGSAWEKIGGTTTISIGDTVTSATNNRIFYYNGGLAQSAGFEYNSGTTTFLAPTIETSSGIIKSTGTSITFQNGATARLVVSSNGVYYSPTATSNTSFGYTAMGTNTGGENTAYGYQSLMSGSLSGSYNTALGSGALKTNTTGYSNSAFGRYALYSNTTGYNNMGFGHTALYLNTTGVGNVAIGLDALRKSTTTDYNVAIGIASMFGGTSPSGAGNIAIGYGTLEVYTSADYNIAIGYRGGAGITTGDYNTIVGYRGAFDLTTGSYNTFVGQRDSSGITTGSYNTIIGHVTGLSSSLSNTIIVADGNGNKGFEWSGTRFTVYGNVVNINTSKTPSSAADTGTSGDVAWDSDYIYVCVAANTWKRAAISTW